MTDWTEVHSAQELLATIGVEVEESPGGVEPLKRLADAPSLKPYLRTRTELPTLPPGLSGMLVPRTRCWVDVSGLKSTQSALGWVAVVIAVAQDLTMLGALALAREVLAHSTLLTEDEAELVGVIVGKSEGDPYKHPVSEQTVSDAYKHATVCVSALLDSLTDKGVVKSRRDGLIQLQF